MSIVQETTIRVPVDLRDKIKAGATERRLRQAEYIDLAIKELEHAEFLRAVAAIEWDEEAIAEAREWDDAPLVANLEPWDPSS
ncbi:MAG: hypothetical protein FWG08_07255 [Propionibacteriaceae bacterium]|nr:hypothetical protein [Propionibacteriaceae bacterium]